MRKIRSLLKRRWLQTLAAGVVLFLATEVAWSITHNPNFIPTMLILGSFTVPVVFVTYIYEYEFVTDVPIKCLATCFLAGGVIGILAAGVIEFATMQNMTYIDLLLVAIIEEASKLIMPGVQYVRRSSLSEADGILFGVASGMGFAALETMGFGMSALTFTAKNISILNQLLFIRGLLSPAGHGAWTGLVTAVIWREREVKKRGILSPVVLMTFGGAVLLHFLWNFVNQLTPVTPSGIALSIVGMGILVLASLTMLVRRLREASRLRRSTDISDSFKEKPPQS